MSAIEMASASKFSYQRLRNDAGFEFYDDEDRERVVLRTRSWSRLKRFTIRKKFKIKVPSLRRFLRRKLRLASNVKVAMGRVVKRLKESQNHLGDLFAGNYLFMQVTPTSLKCSEKSFKATGFNGLPSSMYVAKIA